MPKFLVFRIIPLVSLWLTALCLVFGFSGSRPAVAEPVGTIVVEAEKSVGVAGTPFRDDRASEKRASVILLNSKTGSFVTHKAPLPPGEYVATAWIEGVPVELLHNLEVVLTADGASRTINAYHFDAKGGYQPFSIRFTHAGGNVTLDVAAKGGVGFDGMRKDNTAEENAEKKKGVNVDASGLLEKEKPKSSDEFDLEEDASITKLTHLDYRVACDRIEIVPISRSRAVVSAAEVDKVHYLPGETVKATATILGEGSYTLQTELVTEIDTVRRIASSPVTFAAGSDKAVVEVPIKLDDATEFGHEVRFTLLEGDKPVHSKSEVFGVSRNVYRIGITGSGGFHGNKTGVTPERARAAMERNRRLYANYFEEFAWGPCDYSNLTPKTEVFYSGQTQYPGTITGFKTMIAEAHRLGIKAISYGKACGASYEGLITMQRHPEVFGHTPGRHVGGQYNTWYLDRMALDEFRFPDVPEFRGWQHWTEIWVADSSDKVVDLGADELIRSTKMFGWDGVRWDGHFPNAMAHFKARVNAQLPNWVHGYNIAFANPADDVFLPSDPVDDFHECAKDHGLMMDESVRDWSNTNFSPGTIDRFYRALARESDYMKRIGGLPLYITFDMGSKQDVAFNVACGLAAGQRYTYLTTPGDAEFGSMTRFLTRYSSLVWDDTAMVADAGKLVSVSATPAVPENKGAMPWWDHTTWLRKSPDGRQQLLVNLVNPPRYGAFCNRVQTPPATLKDVVVKVPLPAGAKLARAFHASPDLLNGCVALDAKIEGDSVSVTLPRLRQWSIVGFELAPAAGATLSYPAYPVTDPVGVAKKILDDRAAKAKAAKETQEKREASGVAAPTAKPEPQAPYYADFAKTYNIDKDASVKLPRPTDMNVRRDGVLDVHHVHGIYNWLNPVESAVGLCGGGNHRASWINFAFWRMRGDGCLEDFPDDFEALLRQDVVVIDNVNADMMGPRRRAMLLEYVQNGGGLLVIGGYYNLSMGIDRNTAIGELLPVEIRKYNDLVRDDKGLPLKPVKADFFPKSIDWSRNPIACGVDVSPLKPGVEVLLKAGEHPALVSHQVGKGRVMTLLVNVHGNYAEGAMPYWEWDGYPKLLAACLNWLGRNYKETVPFTPTKRVIDASGESPEQLLIDSATLSSAEFTKRLKACLRNMVDAVSARAALEAAIDNSDKIEDMEVFAQVAERAGNYIDASFASMAKKLVTSEHVFLRRAGYQVLGLSGDKSARTFIERGLVEEDVKSQRAALLAIGRLKDPESVPVVRKYLGRGSQKLLAMGVLRRLGEADALEAGLPMYAHGLRRWVAARCSRLSVFEDLYGGTSFKLTPAARRKLEFEFTKAIEHEQFVDFDNRYFAEGLATLTEADLQAASAFLRSTESASVAPVAYAIAGRLEPARAAPFRKSLADAKLPRVRLLAQE